GGWGRPPPPTGSGGSRLRPTAPRWLAADWGAGLRGGRAGIDWNGRRAGRLRGYRTNANAPSSAPGTGDQSRVGSRTKPSLRYTAWAATISGWLEHATP